MGQSLTKNLIHLTYSTKYRKPWLTASLREALFAYQAGIFNQWDSPPVIIGGFDDHIHALFDLSKNHPLKKIVEEVKKSSSKWIKQNGGPSVFQWQSGYAAFSVSQSASPKVKTYIQNQEEHHRRITFQDELRALFQKHEVEFDERYVWD